MNVFCEQTKKTRTFKIIDENAPYEPYYPFNHETYTTKNKHENSKCSNCTQWCNGRGTSDRYIQINYNVPSSIIQTISIFLCDICYFEGKSDNNINNCIYSGKDEDIVIKVNGHLIYCVESIDRINA